VNYVEVINNYEKEIKEIDLLKDFINYSLDKLSLKNVMFNVIIVDNESIHKINKEYRNVNRPTDVITFALEDDKVIDEILSFKVYQNPKNYDIKNVRELPSLDLEYQYEIDNLTEREKEAFFGTEACKALGISKEQAKVKRIGAKKNV